MPIIHGLGWSDGIYSFLFFIVEGFPFFRT